METKYLTKKLLNELLEMDSYYYIEGSCPELCKYPRLLNYAESIVSNNPELPDKFIEGEVWDLESALKIIRWFGEKVYEVKMPPQSIDFIKE